MNILIEQFLWISFSQTIYAWIVGMVRNFTAKKTLINCTYNNNKTKLQKNLLQCFKLQVELIPHASIDLAFSPPEIWKKFSSGFFVELHLQLQTQPPLTIFRFILNDCLFLEFNSDYSIADLHSWPPYAL